ncbi:sialidase family protein [Klebsiella michiganensis]|uniref:sialidase family protein n=1 Tax=Klebsiella michiganensis TaxID=1134687 RepID=UPI0015F397C7|nr:sialidase family protein [Klebsiella michiganensis]MBA7859838.1 exo-alpha-sialidase [Klebsiella michiganensis]MBA8052663.1 exo-alpha-sialidase [Klebsiella michiganensis]MBL0775412.1 exo-alpha-sialidase [Klebsiella michiganensis]MCZ0061921.1 sialidase family protein [Klebsiella michiganensis]MCZ0077926.1 sialidase family protein [Klebsiella michiganensis]
MNFTQMAGSVLAAMLVVSGCGAKEPPTQVVYRFDDHRYLELKGWNCEGELWYTDTQRGIHSQPYFQFFRIFTKKFVHPSERYLVIPNWDPGAFRVSKDYGKTWTTATYSPGENEPNGDSSPPRDDILSFTVVNDQGFLQTKHRLYMSSKPFDDPRILPGGPGITYTLDDGTVQRIDPQYPGWAWGGVYFTKEGLDGKVVRHEANYQDLPDEVPEVKNYQGWDHMRCDMDVGK